MMSVCAGVFDFCLVNTFFGWAQVGCQFRHVAVGGVDLPFFVVGIVIFFGVPKKLGNLLRWSVIEDDCAVWTDHTDTECIEPICAVYLEKSHHLRYGPRIY